MRGALASRGQRESEDLEWLAPGHGFLVGRPEEVRERLLSHRLGRENKVLNAVRDAGTATLEHLLPLVYDDVSPRLHPVASRSLLAHLIKLRDEGRVQESRGGWSLA